MYSPVMNGRCESYASQYIYRHAEKLKNGGILMIGIGTETFRIVHVYT